MDHTGGLAALLASVAVLSVAVVAQVGLAPAASAMTPAGPPGAVHLIRNATPAFEPWIRAAEDDPGLRRWMRRHYWELRGYAPWFTDHTFAATPPWTPPPTQEYEDLYALYRDSPADQYVMALHPNWVLKSATNPSERLYIPHGCHDPAPGCPQFAADIGNPAFRASWIAAARAQIAHGYVGLAIDDVNLASPIRTAHADGSAATPFDPRTGQAMTRLNWRRYTAEFVEAIKAALPGSEVALNSNQWWVPHGPFTTRVARAADFTWLERGVNDAGITGGSGRFGYESYLANVDWLHSHGSAVMYEPPNGTGPVGRQYELASYFLVKEPSDAIVSDSGSDPDNWWSGWGTDLGRPASKRYTWNGLLRRDFVGGMALVNEPDFPARTAPLPAGVVWHDLGGNRVTTVTLGEARGKVLLTRIDTRQRRLRVKCTRSRGKRTLRVRGRVVDEVGDPLTAGSRGRMLVKVQRERRGRWVQVARRGLRLRRDTEFRGDVRVTDSGPQRYRAAVTFTGTERYFPSRRRLDTCAY